MLVEKTHMEEDLLIAWQTHCTLRVITVWPLSCVCLINCEFNETVAPMCLSSDSPDITASD